MSAGRTVRQVLAATSVMSVPERLLVFLAGAVAALSVMNLAEGHGGGWFVAALGELIVLAQVIVAAGWRERALYWRRRAEQEALVSRLARTGPWPPLAGGHHGPS